MSSSDVMHESGSSPFRGLIAGVACVVPLAAILVVGELLRGALGATMASHWSSGSAPDGFSSTWPTFWGFTAATAVFAALGVLLVVLRTRVPQARVWATLVTLIAGFSAAAWIGAAWATAAASDPAHAVLGWRLAILLIAVVCGGAVYLLLPATRPAPPVTEAVPPLEIRDGDRVAWTGTTGSNLLLGLGVVLGALFVFFLVLALRTPGGGPIVPVILSFVVSLIVLGMSRARLTVDRRGIRLRSAILGIPFISVRLENIATADVERIEPMQWGGWGYRLSSAGLAYVTRRGPGIVVTRHSGNAVAISLDKPAQPVAVLTALIAQRARQR